MEDDGNVAFQAGNDQEEENFMEASVMPWKTSKSVGEKEAFGNQRRLKRQKGNQPENRKKNSSASQEEDINELLTPQETDNAGEKVNCSICGKSIQSKFHLNVHCRLHTDETQSKWIECEKHLRQRPHLHSYQKTRKGEKVHKCMECGKTLIRTGAITLHQRTHTGDKPYKCMECGNNFHQSAHLCSHQRTHTGDKPYK